MAILKKAILSIKPTEGNVLIYGGIGILFIFLGGMLLSMNPPNFQVGYPTIAIGFAFFVFAVSIDNSKKSAKKSDQILAKLDEIHEEIKKKNEP
ncbi:MAG: hypothetical protein ABSG49_02680 [Methanoregula sp.]|uniref:hypothetical protein n=1 Tax=Methanoregula sp. TaxID=2052170 RepID=UPI003C17B559